VSIAKRSKSQKLKDIFRSYFSEEEKEISAHGQADSATLQEEESSLGMREEIPLCQQIQEGKPIQESAIHVDTLNTRLVRAKVDFHVNF